MQNAEESTVIFRGTREGISILLDAEIPFEQLKADFCRKAAAAKIFFGAGRAPVFFKGRALSAEERNELSQMILDEASLDVSRQAPDRCENKTELVPSPGIMAFGREPDEQGRRVSAGFAAQNFRKKIPDLSKEQNAVFHQGALRSGQSIRTAGHVVVMGDVNPGAEIISQGNIIVLGSLKGLVHAGCTGDCDAYIAALLLQPTQLRIAGIITAFPGEIRVKGKKIMLTPSYAYIQNGQIYVSPLMR